MDNADFVPGRCQGLITLENARPYLLVLWITLITCSSFEMEGRSLLTAYLCLPLGMANKDINVWNPVTEEGRDEVRSMAK